MILDYDDELTWTNGSGSLQSIVGTAGSAIVGGRVKDAGAAREWATGECVKVYARVVTAVAGASGGVQFDIVEDTAANLTTSPTVLLTRTIPTASLTVNSLHPIGMVLPTGTRKRYLGVKITPLTSNSTTGEVIVGIVDDEGTPQNGVNWV